MSVTTPPSSVHLEPSTARVRVRKVFAATIRDYFLLLGITLFLVIFGLVMVLSSSSIESHVAGKSFFDSFLNQGLFALIGIPLMQILLFGYAINFDVRNLRAAVGEKPTDP